MGEVVAGIALGPTILGAVSPALQATLFPSDVAGDVDDRQALLVARDPEADDGPGDLLRARRPVECVEGGDGDSADVDAVAGLQADRAVTQALGAGLCRDDVRDLGEQLAAGGIEVVGVVVVGDERDVDRAEIGGRDRGAGELRQAAGVVAGGENVGSVRIRRPPYSIRTVGPPISCTRTTGGSLTRRASRGRSA
jgi:hypothetical protein